MLQDERATLEALEALVARGAIVNYVNPCHGDRTPLFWAAKRNQYRLALFLLECGADPLLNPANKSGWGYRCSERNWPSRILLAPRSFSGSEQEEQWFHQEVCKEVARRLKQEIATGKLRADIAKVLLPQYENFLEFGTLSSTQPSCFW